LIRVINFALNMGLLSTYRFLDDWFLFVFEHDHNFHELFGKLSHPWAEEVELYCNSMH